MAQAKAEKEARTPTTTSTGNSMIKLFAYGTLNVHSIQRDVWGEAKEGKSGHIYDYELNLWPNSYIFYAEPKPGESIPGKVYELTAKQLADTDRFETSAYKRVTLPRKVGETEDIHIYIRNTDKK